MAESQLCIQAAAPFDFENNLQAHGWVDLLPNLYQPESNSFSRVQELSSGKVVQLIVSAGTGKSFIPINIKVRHHGRLSGKEQSEIEAITRHMLRLDENFEEFYILCRKAGLPWSEMKPGLGRLLRSPDLFEDIVKVILTTNVQWGGTRRMVKEMVEGYGSVFPLDPKLKAFPQAEAIAAVPFEAFQSSVRLGYRTAYIYQFACDFAEKPDCYTKFFDAGISSADVRKELLAVKGIGNYAAASVLMLLERYDEIPVDSVFQQLMTQKYQKGREFNLKDALAVYQDWGKWKYLAYWFDLLTFIQTDTEQ